MTLVRIPQIASKAGRQWFKALDRVDTSQTNGYAFKGRFLAQEAGVREELSPGTFVLGYGENKARSGKSHGVFIHLYQVTDSSGLTEVSIWDLSTHKGWALEVRDKIAEYVNVEYDLDQLQAEREQILERLQEIDRLLET